MKMNYFLAKNQIYSIIKHLEKTGGHLSILWHNNTFDFIDFPFMGYLYYKLIKNSIKSKAKVLSMDALFDLLNKKNNIEDED
jgi:ferric iron reductase protein FhuF